MSKKYRVTPKNGKWIIQDIETRKTVSAKPFIKKSDAEDAMFAMSGSDQKVETSISFKEAFKQFAAWKLSLKTENNTSLVKKTFYIINWPCSKCAIFLFALFGSYPKVMAVTKSKMFNKNVEDQTELVIDACRTSFVENSDNPGLMKDNVNDLLASSTTGFIVIILISYLVFKFLI